jgi:hypothetical protein
MDIIGVLHPGYHRPLVTARQPEHDRLYQQPNGRSRAPSVRDGPATPKPSRREGATYPKGSLRRCEFCCLGPSPPPPLVGNQTAHRSTRLGISEPYRMCPTGYDDKPHIPPLEGSQPPDPKPFISRPEALSHSLCMGNTWDSGTRIFSTKEGPTASSTDVPSDKDELNSVPPHVGQLGLATML